MTMVEPTRIFRGLALRSGDTHDTVARPAQSQRQKGKLGHGTAVGLKPYGDE